MIEYRKTKELGQGAPLMSELRDGDIHRIQGDTLRVDVVARLRSLQPARVKAKGRGILPEALVL